MDEFLRMMSEESAEVTAALGVTNAMKTSADAGDSGKMVAKKGLKAFFGPTGPIMALARTLPGWTFPLLGTAFAAMLKKSTFIDRLLPDDGRPVIREAKFLLKNVGPHAVIGAFTGYTQAADQIDRKIDEARSEVSVADDAANMELDWVAMSMHFPGRIFVPARDNVTKKIRYHLDGSPIILDPDFANFKAMWDQTHKATTKTSGKGKDQKTVPVQAEKMHVELYRLTEALALNSASGGSTSRADIEAIKKLLEKPKSWGASLTKRANDFHLCLSFTCSQMGAIDRMIAERLFKDLPGKADIALIEHLAEAFETRPRNPDGTFTVADYRAIIAHIDNFMGAELNLFERTIRSAQNAWNNMGSFSLPLKAFLYGSATGLVAFNLVSVMMFLVSFWWMLESIMFGEGVYHRNRAIICAVTLIVMLFTLKIWQTFLHPILGRLMNSSKDWLVGFGWRFIGMLLPVFFMAMALTPEIGISYFTRWLIIALAFAGVCAGMIFKANEVPASAQLLGIASARYGGLIVAIIIAIDWAVRHSVFGAMASTTSTAWDRSVRFLDSHQWVASVVLFFLVFLPLWATVKWFSKRRFVVGTTRYTEHESHGMITFLIFVAALIVAVSVPWFIPGKHLVDPLEKSEAQSVSEPTGTVVVPLEPATLVTPHRTTGTHTHASQLNCDDLSYEGRQQAECP